MRVFKRGYTIPIPADAKMFTRKKQQYARFNCKGNIIEARLTGNGKRVLRQSEKWYIEFEDNLQRPQTLKAFTNEQASRQLADKVQQLLNYRASTTPLTTELLNFTEQLPATMRDELISFGVIDNPKTKRSMELVSLLTEYEDWLRSTRHRHGFKRTEKHVSFTCSRIRKINEQCGFVVWDDIKSGAVEKYLGSLKVEPETYNGYLVMLKGFCNWVVENDYAVKSPVSKIKPLAEKTKSGKRALLPDEVVRLLDATENAESRFGMTGHDRAVLYLFAIETGLRRGTIKGLLVGDFDFDNNKINIRPEINKNRTEHTVYLKPGRAEQLKNYLRGKLPNVRAFNIAERTANMLKADLRDAGIDFKDSEGRKVVFHSLRYTANTIIQNATHDDIITKKIMGHCIGKQDMTERYFTITEQQIRDIIESTPDYQWPQREAMAATGTDGKAVDKILPESYRPQAQIKNLTSLGGISEDKNTEKGLLQAVNKGEYCLLTAMTGIPTSSQAPLRFEMVKTITATRTARPTKA